MSVYRPIYFQEKFALRKHYGWKLLLEEGNFQLLHRRQGLFHSHLFLFSSAGRGDISRALFQHLPPSRGFGSARVYVFDPSEGLESRFTAGGREFLRCEGTDRMFNTWTFLHDLSRSEEEMFGAFSKGARYACRTGEKAGCNVALSREYRKETVDDFFAFYASMASERGLRIPARSLTEKMFEQKDLLQVEARDSDGTLLQVILVYLSHPYAFYFHGVSRPRAKKEFGQLLQWEAMKWLKAQDYQWYDLGGVPSTSEDNGIYRFKKSMGGRLTGPSVEFGYWHPVYRLGRRVRDLIRP